jgi:DNA polymerase-1
MVDYKGLRGDPSDNIPGVTGVGEKTAIQLLSDFGSIDSLYKEVEKDTEKSKKIKPGLRVKLIQYKDQALFSRELATIRNDVPIDFKLDDLLWKNYDRENAERVLKGLGFLSLVTRLPHARINADTESALISQNPHEAAAVYDKIELLYKEGVFSRDVYDLEKKLAPVL